MKKFFKRKEKEYSIIKRKYDFKKTCVSGLLVIQIFSVCWTSPCKHLVGTSKFTKQEGAWLAPSAPLTPVLLHQVSLHQFTVFQPHWCLPVLQLHPTHFCLRVFAIAIPSWTCFPWVFTQQTPAYFYSQPVVSSYHLPQQSVCSSSSIVLITLNVSFVCLAYGFVKTAWIYLCHIVALAPSTGQAHITHSI